MFVCLTGQSATEIMKQAGVKVSMSFAKQAIQKIPGEVIKSINKSVGFRLVKKFGQKGIVNLREAIPIAGGIIGGTIDGARKNIT